MDTRSATLDSAFAARRSGGSLSHALAVHCADADIAYAALLEESGIVFADSGDPALRDRGETAALAVGAWHATREVARRLGEPDFQGLHHEGRARHFYISPVDESHLLLSVFGNDTRLAIVRAIAVRTAAILRDCLAAGAAPEMPAFRSGSEGDLNLASEYFLAAQ
jgi:hypothetical protein